MIVPVYDFNEIDGQPYLVMKFIEGAKHSNECYLMANGAAGDHPRDG